MQQQQQAVSRYILYDIDRWKQDSDSIHIELEVEKLQLHEMKNMKE